MSLQKIKEEIVKKLKVPVFPNRSFDVTSFGADENGKNDSTEAIQKAIDQAHQAGGGRVTVPEGVFLSGALRLKSNVDLHIAKGAVIKFSQNPEDYLPVVLTRFEGVELYNYSPLIYAYEADNIAITGKGTLDGQGDDEHCGRGKEERTASLHRKKIGTLCLKWLSAVSRSLSGSLEKGIICGRISFSRIAANIY